MREDDELLRAKISDTRMLHLPLSRLASQGVAALPESVRSPDRKVYIICHHGSRSMQVTSWLLKSGLGNVINVRGGIDAYAREVDRSVGLY